MSLHLLGARPLSIGGGTPVSVTLAPLAPSVDVGKTQQFTAVATDAAGNAFTPPVVLWSATGSGTIDPSGLFTATAPGNCTVTAKAGSISGSTTVTITAGGPGGSKVKDDATDEEDDDSDKSRDDDQGLRIKMPWASPSGSLDEERGNPALQDDLQFPRQGFPSFRAGPSYEIDCQPHVMPSMLDHFPDLYDLEHRPYGVNAPEDAAFDWAGVPADQEEAAFNNEWGFEHSVFPEPKLKSPPTTAVGAAFYTDRQMVQKVQLALLALPGFRQDPLFKAVNADGSITVATVNAVARFNQLYGNPSDGGSITDTTITALAKAATDDRSAMGPELSPMLGPATPTAQQNVSDAAIAALDAISKQMKTAAATTSPPPAQVQAAAAQVQGQAASAPPAVKQKVAEAKAAADNAKTPAEVKAAASQVAEAAADVKAAGVSSGGLLSWFGERTLVSSVPNYGVVGGGLGVVGLVGYAVRRWI